MCGFQRRGRLLDRGRLLERGRALIQTCQLRGAIIRKEALKREGLFIRSFTVCICYHKLQRQSNCSTNIYLRLAVPKI